MVKLLKTVYQKWKIRQNPASFINRAGFLVIEILFHLIICVVYFLTAKSPLLIPTSIRTIFHFLPNFLPFFSPRERSPAGYADFCGEVGFLYCFHGILWLNFE